MAKINDRWSALSMKERADLMNMYITNGISDLKEMKKHYNSFGDGGNTKDPVIGDEEAASSFNVNWYKGRAPQLRRAIKDVYDADYLMPSKGLFESHRKMTDDRMVQLVTDDFKDRLSSIKEFTTQEALNDYTARSILTQDYYARYPYEKPNEDEDFIGPSKPVPNDQLEPTLRRQFIEAAYYPGYRTILYDSVIGGDNSTKVHERTHAIVNMSNPILKEVYDIRNELEARGKKIHHYYDAPEEIYARLMSFREKHGLDPTKTITKEDINNWKKNKIKDFDLINRYPVDLLLRLFNDVAQNTTDPNKLDYVNPTNIAAYGGRILDGKTERNQTLSNEPVYYDDTYIEPAVVKAFSSAKEYNRWKGEQGAKAVRKGTNNAAQSIYNGLFLTPILGDALDVTNAAIEAKEGNWKDAAILAGLAFLPNYLDKPLKALKKSGKKAKAVKKVLDPSIVPEYINTIDDVTLDPFSIAEVPESAFIPKEKEVIQLSPTRATREKEKFVEDVVTGAYFARKHTPKKPKLKEFKIDEFGFLDGMPTAGVGAESVVYLGNDIAYKRPRHILEHRITRSPSHSGGIAEVTPLPEFRDIQSIVNDSETYLKDVNKYWFQEPTSLEGYFKWPGTSDRFLPVYSQPKGVKSIDIAPTAEELRQYKYLTEKIPHSNILLENDLPIPYDTHTGNFMVFPDGVLRAIDVHKYGGKLNKFETGGTIEPLYYDDTHIEPAVVTADVMSLENFINLRLAQDREAAVSNILNQQSPLVPNIPSTLGRAFVKMGMSDDKAMRLFGRSKHPHTCIYTTTGMYPKGSQVPGNITFAENPSKYGFEKVNEMQVGDMLQLIDDNGVPYHSAMITGFAENGNPLLTYSNGGRDIDENRNGILDENEHHMRYNKNNLYDDGDDSTPDFGVTSPKGYSIYRYVGNKNQRNEYKNEYKKRFKK